MQAHLLERPSQRLDVGVRQVLREVSLDSVAVVAACLLHGLEAIAREDDEDRATIMLGTDAANETFLLHTIDDTSETALAVEDPLRRLVHGDAVG